MKYLLFTLVITSCNYSVENENLPITEKSDHGGIRTIYETEEFDDSTAFELYLEGLKQVREDEFKEAKEKFKAALAIEPNNELVLNSLGLVEKRLFNFDSAEFFLLKAIEINPEYYPSYSNLGIVYYYDHKYEEAIEVLYQVPIQKTDKGIRRAFYFHRMINYTALSNCDSAQHYYQVIKRKYSDKVFLENVERFKQNEFNMICP